MRSTNGIKNHDNVQTDAPIVVLLHGLGRSRTLTALLAILLRRQLSARGMQLLNLTYPSVTGELGGNVALLHEKLIAAEVLGKRLHFVTHSMGGLLARAYINIHRPSRLGHIVMLTPPNGGSEIIDWFLNARWWGWLPRHVLRKTIPTLTMRRSDDVIAMLGMVDYPLGIIAGTTSRYSPGHYLLPRPNDGTISVASTRLDGMTDHLEVSGVHSFLMFKKDVIAQVLHFLQHGRFSRHD